MRLIDADRLVNMLYDNEYTTLCPLDEVSGVVDACPTIDAVKVTRCNECKHSYTKNRPCDTVLFRWCRKWDNIVRDCDFCSYGERKGGTNNVPD